MSDQKPKSSNFSNPPAGRPVSVRKLAEQHLKADRILYSLAVRNAKRPQIDHLQLTENQAEILRDVDINLVTDPAALQLAVSQRRDALAVRQAGVVELLAKIDRADAMVEQGLEAEFKAMCRIHVAETNLEVGNWDAVFRAERYKRLEAESERAEHRAKYQKLTTAVPGLVHAHTARHNRRIEASAIAQAVRDASADLVQIPMVL
jgi:hypothetical protein